MGNSYFKFKKFTVYQDKCAMKVTTLACLQGAWLPPQRPNRILDIGAGTGLLSLMAAQQIDCPIDAVEIDNDAFHQLKHNLASSPWSHQFKAFHEDILVYAHRQNLKYDLILCNPPFFINYLKSSNSSINLARHDSGLTLSQLVGAVDLLLSDQGNVSILLPPEQTRLLLNLCRERSLYMNRQLVIADRAHLKPNAIVSIFTREESEVTRKMLIIKSDDGSYAPDFKVLLKDYYLNL